MDNPIPFFPSIDGFQTSADGKTCLLRVHDCTGQAGTLSFPAAEIARLLEYAAQSPPLPGLEKEHPKAAFRVTDARIDQGLGDDTILSLDAGSFGKIHFVLSSEIVDRLMDRFIGQIAAPPAEVTLRN